MAKQEGRIPLALGDIETGRITSLRAAAKLYDMPFSTMRGGATGISSRVDTRAKSYKLTQLEEGSLVKWILSVDSRGAAPRSTTIREMADIVLATRGE